MLRPEFVADDLRGAPRLDPRLRMTFNSRDARCPTAPPTARAHPEAPRGASFRLWGAAPTGVPPPLLVGVGISPQPGLTQPLLHRHPRERGHPESRASWSCPARFAALAVPSISTLVMLDSRVRGKDVGFGFQAIPTPTSPPLGGQTSRRASAASRRRGRGAAQRPGPAAAPLPARAWFQPRRDAGAARTVCPPELRGTAFLTNPCARFASRGASSGSRGAAPEAVSPHPWAGRGRYFVLARPHAALSTASSPRTRGPRVPSAMVLSGAVCGPGGPPDLTARHAGFPHSRERRWVWFSGDTYPYQHPWGDRRAGERAKRADGEAGGPTRALSTRLGTAGSRP